MGALLVAAIVAEIPWQLLGNEISPFFIYNVRLFVLMVSSASMSPCWMMSFSADKICGFRFWKSVPLRLAAIV